MKNNKNQQKKKVIGLKIKTMNHSIFQIFADPSQEVLSIQGQIQQKTSVPITSQRLLYRGIYLQPSRLLSHYQIQQGSVLVLIANKIPSQYSHKSSLRKSEVARIQNHNKQHNKFKKHMYLQQRTNGFYLSTQESIQVLQQSKYSIDQLLTCLNFNYQNETTPFKFQRRKLKVGEWVDVRDVSGQWAEGQVVNIYNQYVFVHFNGWPQRMNEWISANSQRIMPFRSYTVQSQQCTYLSPCPKIQAQLCKKNNPNFQSQISQFIEQLTKTIEGFSNLMKDLQFQTKNSQNKQAQIQIQIQKDQSLKNMSHNSNQAYITQTQNRIKDIDQVQQIDRKQEYYTPSKQIRANDNLSNKAQDDISKCDNDDISNKSYTSKRSEGLVDTQSMKSLIIEQSKNRRQNKIFFDNSQAQSVKSVKNKNPIKLHYYNQEYILEEEDSQYNDQQENNEAFHIFRKKQMKRKLKMSQLAPIADRLGRLLVDLSPHLALLGYQQQSVNNFNENLSTFTNEGSLQSKLLRAHRKISQQQQKQNMNNSYQCSKYCQFQVPVMLTPSQISRLTRLLEQEKKNNNIL